MRICELVQTLYLGGMERMVASLSLGLSSRGHSVTVCCYDGLGHWTNTLNAGGVPVCLVLRKAGIDWSLPRKIARVLRENRIEVLHCHNDTALFYGYPAARMTGIPVVYTEHSLKNREKRLKKFVHSMFFRGTAMVTAVAEEIGERLEKEERAPKSRVRVVWNGVDGSLYEPRDGTFIRRKREELGISSGAIVLGTVGRYYPEKNYGMLLEVICILREECNPVLVMVGDGPLMNDFVRDAKRLGVLDNLRILGERGDTQNLYPAFDLFLLSSVREGMPLVVIEAMACALPVVSTNVGGIRNIVKDGNTGFLVPPGDASAMANRIRTLMANATLREQFGRSARDFFERNLSVEQMVGQYESVYREVVQG
jgi:glycosyltransferase involved in cell wall biosynthesis